MRRRAGYSRPKLPIGQILTKTRPTIDDCLDRSEVTTVMRVRAVVSEHEDIASWYDATGCAACRLAAMLGTGRAYAGGVRLRRGRRRDAGKVRGRPLREVGLLQRMTVDEHAALAIAGHGLTREADHALDEVLDVTALRTRWRVEHDDVTAVHIVDLVAQLVDEDTIADVQRRFHRRRRDVERLEQERLDQERDEERRCDEHDPFDDHTPSAVRRSRVARRGFPIALRRRLGGDGSGWEHGRRVGASPPWMVASDPSGPVMVTRPAPRPPILARRWWTSWVGSRGLPVALEDPARRPGELRACLWRGEHRRPLPEREEQAVEERRSADRQDDLEAVARARDDALGWIALRDPGNVGLEEQADTQVAGAGR